MKAISIVDAGGFTGSVLRYWFSAWLFRMLDKPWFPFGPPAVNMLGCLVVGLISGVADQRRVFDQELRLFVFLGVLGSFTTFSAFAYETATTLRDAPMLGARPNVGLQVFLGLIAVWLGGLVSRLV